MTAARSDLMALAADSLEQASQTLSIMSSGYFAEAQTELSTALATDAGRCFDLVNSAIENIRLAASQPDREAVGRIVHQFKHQLLADQREYLIDAILSLLSGAGTKSDGGVEVRHAATGNMPGSVPGEEMSSTATSLERSAVQGAAIQPCAGVTPGLSDPSPGPDVSLSAPVGEPVALIERDALAELRKHKFAQNTVCSPLVTKPFGDKVALYLHPPAPAVVPDVREALEALVRDCMASDFNEHWESFKNAEAALTRPLGGFVQGSIARKQSTDPEGSSRTETAIATMLCKSGKFETGEGTCAFVCMGGLGDVRKDGCSHAKFVHAKLAATIAEGLRAECGYDQGYADGVEWATCHAAVAETDADAQRDDGLLSGDSNA